MYHPAKNTITIFRQHQPNIEGVQESLKPAQLEICPIFFTKIWNRTKFKNREPLFCWLTNMHNFDVSNISLTTVDIKL